MSIIQESIEVDVPVNVAYNQWTQFESFPQFMSGVEAVEQIDDTHLHWRTRVAGVEREFDATITEQRPDQRVAWRSTNGVDHAGEVTFHRLSSDSCRVVVQIGWDPDGVAENVGSAVGADDLRVKSGLKRFKAFIEDRDVPSGAWRGEVR